MRRFHPIAAIVIIFVFVPSAGLAQELHANFRVQVGGTDGEYPGCNGRMLAFLGASLEIGQPLFLEILGEKMGAGGEDCLPGRHSANPDRPFASAIITEPTSRASLGVGRRFVSQHISTTLRAGRFLNSREEFVSSNTSLRIFVFTAGFELGKVNGRWEFDDGTKYRHWSTFGGFSVGLRF
jgi:hypothetical protein